MHEDITGLDALSFDDSGREAVAFHGDRVDADVDEDLDVVVGLDAEGVAGVGGHDDVPGYRGHDRAVGGDNAGALAHDAGGEDGVGHLLEVDDPAGDRADDADVGGSAGPAGRFPVPLVPVGRGRRLGAGGLRLVVGAASSLRALDIVGRPGAAGGVLVSDAEEEGQREGDNDRQNDADEPQRNVGCIQQVGGQADE